MPTSPANPGRLRDMAIGAVLSLGVTVIGGLAVYYFTRSAPPIADHEQLVYRIDPVASFEAQRTRVSFTTLVVANVGTIAAHNVRAVFDPGPEVRIRDRQITLSSGAAGTFSVADSLRRRFSVSVPVLAPKESLTVKLLFDSPPAASAMTLAVKSEASIGHPEGSLVPALALDRKRNPADTIPFLAALLIVIQFGLLRSGWRLRGYASTPHATRNNTGFLFLHAGLTDRAYDLFDHAAKDLGTDDSHILANFALAADLKGEHDLGDKLLVAATFYARTRHQRAVVEFNRALISLRRGDVSASKKALVEAARLSGKEVRRYLKYSSVVRELRNDAAKASILDEAQDSA